MVSNRMKPCHYPDGVIPGIGNGDVKGLTCANGAINNNNQKDIDQDVVIEQQHVNLKRRVGLISGIALIVGTMIGRYR